MLDLLHNLEAKCQNMSHWQMIHGQKKELLLDHVRSYHQEIKDIMI